MKYLTLSISILILSGCSMMSAISDIKAINNSFNGSYENLASGNCTKGYELENRYYQQINELKKLEEKGWEINISEPNRQFQSYNLYAGRCGMHLGNIEWSAKYYKNFLNYGLSTYHLQKSQYWLLETIDTDEWLLNSFKRKLFNIKPEDIYNIAKLNEKNELVSEFKWINLIASAKASEMAKLTNIDIAINSLETKELQNLANNIFKSKTHINAKNYVINMALNNESISILKTRQLNELIQKSEKFRRLISTNPIQDIDKLFAKNQAYIDFIYYENQIDGKKYWIVTLIKDGNVNYKVVQDNIGVENLITELRSNIQNPLIVERISQKISATLIAPYSNELKSAESIIISPTSQLSVLPWDIVLQSSDIVNKKYAIVQSLGMYALLKERYQELQDINFQKDMLIVSKSDFSDVNKQKTALMKEEKDRVGLDKLYKQNWETLTSVQSEAINISTLSPAINVLSEKKANKQNLFNMLNSKEQHKYLHIASHAYLDSDNPQHNAVVLSPTNNADIKSSYLTASEIMSYPINSELVVLSACNTGNGKVTSNEGVLGIPYSLYIAGSVNTILSLWKVDDDATAEFMNRFWQKKISGMKAHEALALTKKEFANGEVKTKWQQPYYWSAFVLYGIDDI